MLTWNINQPEVLARAARGKRENGSGDCAVHRPRKGKEALSETANEKRRASVGFLLTWGSRARRLDPGEAKTGPLLLSRKKETKMVQRNRKTGTTTAGDARKHVGAGKRGQQGSRQKQSDTSENL